MHIRADAPAAGEYRVDHASDKLGGVVTASRSTASEPETRAFYFGVGFRARKTAGAAVKAAQQWIARELPAPPLGLRARAGGARSRRRRAVLCCPAAFRAL